MSENTKKRVEKQISLILFYLENIENTPAGEIKEFYHNIEEIAERAHRLARFIEPIAA